MARDLRDRSIPLELTLRHDPVFHGSVEAEVCINRHFKAGSRARTTEVAGPWMGTNRRCADARGPDVSEATAVALERLAMRVRRKV
jgi:hypothetical protein